MSDTPTTNGRLLLTAREVAKTLAISPRLLWTLTNRGDLPCVRLGRAVRYDRRDVERFINQRKRAGGRR